MKIQVLLISENEAICNNYLSRLSQENIDLFTIKQNEKYNNVIRNLRPDAIIIDMTGSLKIEILEDLKTNFPDIIRMLISNSAKDKKIVQIVFEGLAKTVFNPIPDINTSIKIKNILRIRNEIDSDDVKEFIMGLDTLPSLPTLYHDLTQALREDKDMSVIAKIIKKEPSLAADILKTVNSPAYNIETSSLQTALSFLGMNSLKDVIVSYSSFNESIVPPKSIPYLKILQDHSRLSNDYTHKIYEFLFKKKIDKDSASIPLIGNIGLVLLLKSDHNKFVEYLEQLKDYSEYNYELLDEEIFNMTHSKLGGYLFNWWELPIFTTDVVLNHHKEFIINPDTRDLIEAFNAADILAWKKLGYLKNAHVDERYTDCFMDPVEYRKKMEQKAKDEREKAEAENRLKSSEQTDSLEEIAKKEKVKKKSFWAKIFPWLN
ncbi:MAG: HDOD domain-containing protein [Candidatus Delongbacteria bacterium]|nr:HDOD domain-containing protein [Candidatus Delongbacteria bacterium]MBN2834205.1 HDOD domain-containing protein [Candidatus Delongbacteria bacterium]